jgi:hypothetical protein
MGNV